jgi:hypothetical protein
MLTLPVAEHGIREAAEGVGRPRALIGGRARRPRASADEVPQRRHLAATTDRTCAAFAREDLRGNLSVVISRSDSQTWRVDADFSFRASALAIARQARWARV